MADGRVSAQRVVKSLDIVEHTGPRPVSAPVGLASGPFSLQRGEEALHRRVVPDIAARLVSACAAPASPAGASIARSGTGRSLRHWRADPARPVAQKSQNPSLHAFCLPFVLPAPRASPIR